MNTFDESKVRRGQPGNKGQFREFEYGAPGGQLAAQDDDRAESLVTCYVCGSDLESASELRRRTCDDCHKERVAEYGGSSPQEGGRSPWGEIQYITPIAPGITSVGTAGHGGVKLSPARNAEVPAPLRNANGWYEEDVEAYIVSRSFPDEAAAWRGGDATASDQFDESDRAVRDYFPDQWEAATGETLKPGESRERDWKLLAEANLGNFTNTSARAPDLNEFPELDGMVVVSAKRNEDGATEQFLVPRDEYKAGHGDGMPGQFIIDESRHERWSVAPTPAKLDKLPARPASDVLPDPRHADLTPRQRADYERDLGARYRLRDGRVVTFEEMLDERGGVTGKTVFRDERGKATWYLEHPDSGITAVKAATWKASTAHDTRTPAMLARDEFDLAQVAVDRAAANFDYEAGVKARERRERARAKMEMWRSEERHQREQADARIAAAGPTPTRDTLAADLAEATAAIESFGGWHSSPQHLQDRYERLRRYGVTHSLFR